ncbi:DUF3231 family protein [Lederbergia galactosidilytica]|uniref:DUF3231 family protein n=1 Tax=Lederbergia galactosidilytica TaxID=217031 RepID=A0A177ZGR7_9BACI|nr:DUF3231 family protein [Lederbergia galactosidilytica]KRG14780.1 hypothetical protein ACA30_10045 [Virgibacillus soli]MBP1915857.1 hypothetical protein [Lederbergia galactosidilytica]OAK67126.1 hypothetical protein ABB05_21425 [Lederbergia galactosidilytica]
MVEGKQIRLTSGEITQLYMQYMEDSATVCSLSFFLEKAEDTEIKPIIKHALQLSQTHVHKIKSILTEEKHKIPHGFKVEEDVDLTAPRLYADSFILTFIHQMAAIGLRAYAASLSLAVRSDITTYYKERLQETMELYEMSKDLLLSKGLYIRAPYLPNLDEVNFVKKQSFLWDIFGEKRPLIGSELTNLYSNIQRNALGTATLTGFSQVAQAKDVTKFMLRCIDIAKKHITVFSEKLKESNLPVPMTWDTDISKSTTNTFSDKLMMYYTTSLISLSIGFYGLSIAQSPRVDLGVMYNRLSLEIQKLSEDGANIMIKNKWLEQPPMVPNRKDLAKGN